MNQILAYTQYKTRQENFQVINTEVARNDHKFREEILDPEKPLFVSRVNKQTGGFGGQESGSIADARPQESINKDARVAARLKFEEEERMNRMLNITTADEKPWVENIPTVDRRQMVGGKGAFPLLEKGMFDEDQLNQVNMGGAVMDDKPDFKLFFRTLGCQDRENLEVAQE